MNWTYFCSYINYKLGNFEIKLAFSAYGDGEPLVVFVRARVLEVIYMRDSQLITTHLLQLQVSLLFYYMFVLNVAWQ